MKDSCISYWGLCHRHFLHLLEVDVRGCVVVLLRLEHRVSCRLVSVRYVLYCLVAFHNAFASDWLLLPIVHVLLCKVTWKRMMIPSSTQKKDEILMKCQQGVISFGGLFVKTFTDPDSLNSHFLFLAYSFSVNSTSNFAAAAFQ